MNLEGELACCAVCNLKSHQRCARCLKVYYCNTDHQRKDWKRHKSECAPKLPKDPKKITGDRIQERAGKSETSKSTALEDCIAEVSNESSESAKSRDKVKEGSDGVSKHNSLENSKQTNNRVLEYRDSSVISSVVYTNQELTGASAITYEGSSEQEILNETAQQLSTVEFNAGTSNVLRAVNRADKMPEPPRFGVVPPGYARSKVKEYPEASLRGSSFVHSNLDLSDSYYDLCQRVIRDMSQFGVCVLNNFLGKERGQLVLNEVLDMYKAGIFSKGQLVSNPSTTEVQTIRSDLITWIDGKESHCTYIRQLINQVDNIILRANKMPNNGKMGDYIINGRTKAMVACYPGSGSHYVKHVDNPNKDGRCITAIYYLNLDWDLERCGGLLRVFPEGTNQVANIEPIFDRMLFFWSDRRNPHEVQPAFGTRYAITLWYFDAREREDALRNYKERGQQATSSK